jgi:hypothetical protein
MASSDRGGHVRELIIGGRTITVSHIETEATEYGDIQRYRIDLTGSDAVTCRACARRPTSMPVS